MVIHATPLAVLVKRARNSLSTAAAAATRRKEVCPFLRGGGLCVSKMRGSEAIVEALAGMAGIGGGSNGGEPTYALVLKVSMLDKSYIVATS